MDSILVQDCISTGVSNNLNKKYKLSENQIKLFTDRTQFIKNDEENKN